MEEVTRLHAIQVPIGQSNGLAIYLRTCDKGGIARKHSWYLPISIMACSSPKFTWG